MSQAITIETIPYGDGWAVQVTARTRMQTITMGFGPADLRGDPEVVADRIADKVCQGPLGPLREELREGLRRELTS